MRIVVLASILAFLAAPLLAQTPSKLPPIKLPPITKNPEAQVVTTTQGQAVATLTDAVSPDSASRWRVHPVRIGNIFLNQIHEERNGRRQVIGYRSAKRTMTLSIFNPSITKSARIRVECGSNARLDARDMGIKMTGKNSYWRLSILPKADGRGDANCSIVSDIPIMVAAFIVDTIREKETPGYDGGVPMQQTTTSWPAFRLNRPG